MMLSNEQKEQILEIAQNNPDITHITRRVFNDRSLTARNVEGRAVKAWLVENGVEFATRQRKKKPDIELTDGQKEFIRTQVASGLSSWGIAQILFTEKDIKQMGMEQRAVMKYMEEEDLEGPANEALSEYSPPKAPSRVLKKINDAAGTELELDKLNRRYMTCVERLGVHLTNSRFIKIMNNYKDATDRELFEQEFIRLTWDKPDLTADEVNLYMNVCKDTINLETISKHLNKLNEMFDVADDQSDMSVRLAEIIKAKSAEYHQCENRISNLTKKLQGDRGERMKNKVKANASILSVVQFFQEEEERKNMVKMAERQKLLVKKEAERFESMEEWIVRIKGLDMDDVV